MSAQTSTDILEKVVVLSIGTISWLRSVRLFRPIEDCTHASSDLWPDDHFSSEKLSLPGVPRISQPSPTPGSMPTPSQFRHSQASQSQSQADETLDSQRAKKPLIMARLRDNARSVPCLSCCHADRMLFGHECAQAADCKLRVLRPGDLTAFQAAAMEAVKLGYLRSLIFRIYEDPHHPEQSVHTSSCDRLFDCTRRILEAYYFNFSYAGGQPSISTDTSSAAKANLGYPRTPEEVRKLVLVSLSVMRVVRKRITRRQNLERNFIVAVQKLPRLPSTEASRFSLKAIERGLAERHCGIKLLYEDHCPDE